MIMKQWQRIRYATHTAHRPDNDTLLLSLIKVFGEKNHTFSNLLRKKCSLIKHSTERQDIFLTPIPHHFSSSLEMSSFSFVADNTMSHDVQWRNDNYDKVAGIRKVDLPFSIFLLCHSLMGVFEAYAELRAGLWCQKGKVSVSRWMCVFSTELFVQGKVEVSIPVAWLILAFHSIWVLHHKSFRLPLININIILHYPLPLSLITTWTKNKTKWNIKNTE